MNQVFPIVPASSKTLWLMGIFALVMLWLLFFFAFIAYSSQQVQFEVNNQTLIIRGDIYGRNIPLTSLVVNKAKLVELNSSSPYQPRLRTNGIGLPGYRSGWFKLKNGEKALLFVTESQQVVYIPTQDGYALLMSVKKPREFLEFLVNLKGKSS